MQSGDATPHNAYARLMSEKHLTYLPYMAALMGVCFLSAMDAFMKGASLAIGAYSAAILRSAIGTVIIAPIWLGTGGKWPNRTVLKVHVLRGIVSAFMALSFFYALTKLPIAEAIAISFIAPLVTLYLAAILLGEVIRREAIYASLLGFAGTVIIVSGRLGAADFDVETMKGLGAILFSAALYAWNFIIIRQQALISSPAEATTFHSGVSFATLAMFAPWFLTMPPLPIVGSIAAAAALTVAGALSLTWAYARAEAQYLVPLEYSGFLWAAMLGWYFFAEAITMTTVAGAMMIVVGCLVATRRRPEQSDI